jgi:hypothetical protein
MACDWTSAAKRTHSIGAVGAETTTPSISVKGSDGCGERCCRGDGSTKSAAISEPINTRFVAELSFRSSTVAGTSPCSRVEFGHSSLVAGSLQAPGPFVRGDASGSGEGSRDRLWRLHADQQQVQEHGHFRDRAWDGHDGVDPFAEVGDQEYREHAHQVAAFRIRDWYCPGSGFIWERPPASAQPRREPTAEPGDPHHRDGSGPARPSGPCLRRRAAGGGNELAGGATLPQAPSVECDLPRAYGRSPLTQMFHLGPRAAKPSRPRISTPPRRREMTKLIAKLLLVYVHASRTASASQASAVGAPSPGLMSKRSGASEAMRQPSPSAARSSPSVTRRGPQSPGWRSLKHIR